MSWTAILTALVLSIVSADLVLIEGWPAWRALSMVGGGALFIVMILVGAMVLSLPAEKRGSFLQRFKQGLHDEWRATIKWLTGR